MGYACPVCDEPQQDAEHLANHLAFQAMIHGDDHESWLDEHTPGWEAGGRDELAPRVAAAAEEAEYEVVFDDTAPERDGDEELYDPDLQGVNHHEHGHSHDHGDSQAAAIDIESANLGPEERQIVEDARELTREMLDDGGERDETD